MAIAIDVARREHPRRIQGLGAVVVARVSCIGVGWHGGPGGAHAEVMAIHSAGACKKARRSTSRWSRAITTDERRRA
jgi:pyrimidine deaminase RibD-like protein